MTAPRPLWLLVNEASGSFAEDVVETLVDALAGAGHAPARIVRLPGASLPARAELEQAGVGTLAVFTGDGTINAAIAALQGWGGTVLVLPGGTQNLLAKALHGDTEGEEIIARFGAGALVEQSRRLARTSQGDALIEVVAGPGAIWSDVREELREGNVVGIATTLTEAVRQSAAGPMVALTDPPAGSPDGYAAVRIEPRDDALAVEGYGADTIADYARQGLALLRRNFREGPHEVLGAFSRLVCRSTTGEPIELMLDGEHKTGEPIEEIVLAPCGVTLLASPMGAR